MNYLSIYEIPEINNIITEYKIEFKNCEKHLKDFIISHNKITNFYRNYDHNIVFGLNDGISILGNELRLLRKQNKYIDLLLLLNSDYILQEMNKELENKNKELENKNKELENKNKELENKNKELEKYII